MSSFCDTCFQSSYGGVTLREQAGQEAQLIYAADPAPGAEAFYHLVGVRLPEPVIDALLGVAELRGVVALKRRTFTWEQVHIHLDAVEGLGDFIEIEAPIGERTTSAQARAQLEQARQALGVREESQVRRTYVELLRSRAAVMPEAL